MHLKLRVRSRVLKAVHHKDFLHKCLEAGRVPKGLRIHYQEIHLMDSPTSTKTRAKLTKTYKHTQWSIVEALIEHYVNVEKESEEDLLKVEETIKAELDRRGPEASATYKAFLKKLEWSEDSQRSILSDRRHKKLSQLTPHTHTHTSLLQTSHTLGPQTPTPARKTLGQYPVKHGKGQGPKRDNALHKPYRKPDRTPLQPGNRPVLLPPPEAPSDGFEQYSFDFV